MEHRGKKSEDASNNCWQNRTKNESHAKHETKDILSSEDGKHHGKRKHTEEHG